MTASLAKMPEPHADADLPLSTTHVVVLPSYNTGRILEPTVREACEHWNPVWLYVDGSDDDSFCNLTDPQTAPPNLRVVVSPKNRGKGATALAAARDAQAAGYSHMLLMDSDGQHAAECIQGMMNASLEHPDHLIMGAPRFGPDIPWERRWGRKLTLGLTALESGFKPLADTLFGFRVYPVGPLIRAMEATRFARRYDFDPEVAVRLSWQGLTSVKVPVPVRYPSKAEGGVSHFHYVRDNARMVWLHTRIISQLLFGWMWPFRKR